MTDTQLGPFEGGQGWDFPASASPIASERRRDWSLRSIGEALERGVELMELARLFGYVLLGLIFVSVMGIMVLLIAPLVGIGVLVMDAALVWFLLRFVMDDPDRSRIGAVFAYLGRVLLGSLLWLLVLVAIAIGIAIATAVS